MPKPVQPDAYVTDARVAATYDAALEAWGEEGWARLGRTCRWNVKLGMADPGCAPAPADPR